MCIKLKLQSQRKEVTAMDSNITIEQISDLFDTKITQLKNDGYNFKSIQNVI